MPPTTMSHATLRALLDRGHALRQAVPGDLGGPKDLRPDGFGAAGARERRTSVRRGRSALQRGDFIDEETARTVLAAIGDAATSAEARLRAESIHATAE